MAGHKKESSPRRRGRPATNTDRTIQSSVSLRPTQWERIDALGTLTERGRSGVLAQAVELYTSLPVPLTQRWAALNRTRARWTLRERLNTAFEEAIAEAEAELPADPWVEFDAALLAVGDDVAGTAASRLSEKELIAATQAAKQRSRRRASH